VKRSKLTGDEWRDDPSHGHAIQIKHFDERGNKTCTQLDVENICELALIQESVPLSKLYKEVMRGGQPVCSHR
jgi:hypothetical protein